MNLSFRDNKIFNWIRNQLNFRKSDPADGQYRIWGIPNLYAGIRVDEDTALKYSAVFAAVRCISETIGTLPFDVFTVDVNGRKIQQPNSLTARLLQRNPNYEMTPCAFKETLTTWAVNWGRGVAYIERDNANRPKALWPISPDRVELKRDRDSEELYWEITGQGSRNNIPDRDIFHIHGLGFDGLTGYSVISLAAQSIGLGLASETYGSSFFGNNTQIGGILEYPHPMDDETHKRLKDSWDASHAGPARSWKVAILENGMKYNSAGIPPKDSQFLESRQFQVLEIARWYRVPPHKIADLQRATWNNIESENISFVNDTILPWSIRWEEEVNRKLLPPNMFAKLNLNALLRGDTAARSDFYKSLFQMGVFSVDEIREFEDMNPIGPEAGGDARLVQINLATLKELIEKGNPKMNPPAAPNRGNGATPPVREDEDETAAAQQ